MKLNINNRHQFVMELRRQSDLTGMPLYSESVTADMADLVEESYIAGVLNEKLPAEPDEMTVEVKPVWLKEPLVDKVEVELVAGLNGNRVTYTKKFAAGRWVRSGQAAALGLREEGTLADDEAAYRLLMAVPQKEAAPLEVPPLQPPPICEQTLEDFGVRSLGAGSLVPDRPLLVNQRLAADAVARCEEAGTTETGGAVLGKIVRLPEPLPGTQTRIITILSATVQDPRHEGAPLSFYFSPEALDEAARIGDLRGMGETVQTVFHTHGWSKTCADCNKNSKCPLAECNPSLQDYQLLESLFSSKATLMPIAGRKMGEHSKHPILQVHAWRGGEMLPIRWQEYCD
ncbi:MAG: hypothetical protein H8E44_37925 [Planctomycetes bacterium]|nr:hypothetical protein [Planctomycetota bacterium]MBL7040750.1 hypothetical protein [Pirellulaceae bacterium]